MGVLAGSTLPWAVWVSKVNSNIWNREHSIRDQLAALNVGFVERLVRQPSWQLSDKSLREKLWRNTSIPSHALRTVKCMAKRWQGKPELRNHESRAPTLLSESEGHSAQRQMVVSARWA
ncbi:hypothetical protein ABIA55_002889 [Pseudomonas frederiksbergensis]